MRHGLDVVDLQNPKVRRPTVRLEGKSSPWPVVILAAEAERAKDYAVTAVSRASGSVTVPGVASAASVEIP